MQKLVGWHTSQGVFIGERWVLRRGPHNELNIWIFREPGCQFVTHTREVRFVREGSKLPDIPTFSFALADLEMLPAWPVGVSGCEGCYDDGPMADNTVVTSSAERRCFPPFGRLVSLLRFRRAGG